MKKNNTREKTGVLFFFLYIHYLVLSAGRRQGILVVVHYFKHTRRQKCVSLKGGQSMSIGIVSIGTNHTNLETLEAVHLFCAQACRKKGNMVRAQFLCTKEGSDCQEVIRSFIDDKLELVILGWGTPTEHRQRQTILEQLLNLSFSSQKDYPETKVGLSFAAKVASQAEKKVVYVPLDDTSSLADTKTQIAKVMSRLMDRKNSYTSEHVHYYFGLRTKDLEPLKQELHQQYPTLYVQACEEDGHVTLRLEATGFVHMDKQIQATCRTYSSTHYPYEYVGDAPLSKKVLELLRARKYTVTAAESLTGGAVMSYLSKEAGASAVFEGGIVSYSARVKNEDLHVRKETIEEFGVVSAACAKEMAEHVRTLFRADISVALTGVAGPDPLEGHPAGVVWIAVAKKGAPTWTHKFLFPFNREKNREYAVLTATNMVRLRLEGVDLPKDVRFREE